MKEKFRNNKDEYWLNDMARKAEELLSAEARVKYDRVKEQVTAMHIIVASMLQVYMTHIIGGVNQVTRCVDIGSMDIHTGGREYGDEVSESQQRHEDTLYQPTVRSSTVHWTNTLYSHRFPIDGPLSIPLPSTSLPFLKGKMAVLCLSTHGNLYIAFIQ